MDGYKENGLMVVKNYSMDMNYLEINFKKISQRNLPGKQEERTRDKKGKNRKQRSFLGTDLVF